MLITVLLTDDTIALVAYCASSSWKLCTHKADQ